MTELIKMKINATMSLDQRQLMVLRVVERGVVGVGGSMQIL